MTRKEARDQAFVLVFEKSLNEYDVAEVIEAAKECRDFEVDEDGYVVKVFTGVYDNIDEIDAYISKNLSAWSSRRGDIRHRLFSASSTDSDRERRHSARPKG